MSLVEQLKKWDRKQLFIVFLIFLLGFGFRAHLLKYELFFEFDSYWHARMTEQIIKTGAPFTTDPMSYYQLGGGPMSYTGLGWWYITAAFYKVFSLPITFGAYDKALWIGFVKFLPAFFGALTCIAMFLFFREMYGKRAGYLAGFFTAVSSGYIYRTMAGFFEGSSLVFLFMVLGFYFLARALKSTGQKSRVKNSLAAGLLLGITGCIGGWYLIVSYAMLPFAIAGALILWFRNKDAVGFLKVVGLAIVVFAAMNFVFGLDFIFPGINGQWMRVHPPTDWLDAALNYVKPYIGLVHTTTPTVSEAEGDIGAVFRSSVGEQSSGVLSFGTKFNALIIFPVLALFLIPLRLWRKKEDSISLLLFFWIAATFAMAYFRLQMTFAFGLGVAAAAAFVSNEVFEFLQGRTSLEKKILAVGIALFAFIGVASSALFTSQQVPNIESEAGWKESLEWLKTNTPEGSKMFNWWDEGHWISFIGERKVLLDNRNIDLNGDSAVALAVVTPDVNQACKIIRGYGSDYAIFGSDLLAKEQSLALYAYRTLNSNNPNIQGLGGTAIMSCTKTSGGYQCGNNSIPDAQMNSIPTGWTDKPTQFIDERTALFAYKSKGNSYLYLVIGSRLNDSFLARAWFNDPSVDCLQFVHGETVKIFKVK